MINIILIYIKDKIVQDIVFTIFSSKSYSILLKKGSKSKYTYHDVSKYSYPDVVI